MKIKEILFDYTNPIDIPTKNLADDVNNLPDNFKKALHDNVGSPYNTEKRYREFFKYINTCFKQCILHNKRSKTGIFVGQHKNYSIDIAAKEYYDFTVSRNNLQMDYTSQKLYKMTLVEVSILLLHMKRSMTSKSSMPSYIYFAIDSNITLLIGRKTILSYHSDMIGTI